MKRLNIVGASLWLLGPALAWADPPNADTARLKSPVERLDVENSARLRELVAQRQDRTQQTKLEEDASRFTVVYWEWKKDTTNKKLRDEVTQLAMRLAPVVHCQTIWQALLDTGVLCDGLSLREAEKLLGPAMDKTEAGVSWYFNPERQHHVAPCLHANLKKDQLSGWQISLQ